MAVSMSVCVFLLLPVFVCQIVGNGSEQQLQRELEDVLMDPSVADTGLGSEAGMDTLGGGDHGLLPTTASPVAPGSDPLSAPPPPKLEMVLPVQTAQESELNERSYRGEPWCDFSYPVSAHTMVLIFSFIDMFLRHSDYNPRITQVSKSNNIFQFFSLPSLPLFMFVAEDSCHFLLTSCMNLIH